MKHPAIVLVLSASSATLTITHMSKKIQPISLEKRIYKDLEKRGVPTEEGREKENYYTFSSKNFKKMILDLAQFLKSKGTAKSSQK